MVDSRTPVYAFPSLDTSDYVRRVLSEKRMLVWLQLVSQAIGTTNVNIEELKICGKHFVSGRMAQLTDVRNIDWMPTLNMNIKLQFTDHIAHFDMYNVMTLVKDSRTTEDPKNPIMPVNEIGSYTEPVQPVPQPTAPTIAPLQIVPSVAELPLANPVIQAARLVVGLKCILCLSNVGLKPLKAEDNVAINLMFKNSLRVKSELICNKCSKSVNDFYAFYREISAVQAKISLRSKVEPIIPVEEPPSKKPRLVEKRRTGKLFEKLPTNQFGCKLCQVTLATKAGLNDHLYHAHKVKISCRACQLSFSPEGYTKHRKECVKKENTNGDEVKKKTPGAPVAVPSSAKPSTSTATKSSVPTEASIQNAIQEAKNKESQDKYSCYICKDFFSPTEMIDHVKTHQVQVKAPDNSMKEMIACKQCNRAVLKDAMERHMKTHETQRARLRQLIKEQEERQTYTCCDMKFKSIAMLEKHKKTHKFVNSEDKIECPECKSIIKASYYKAHFQLMHDKELFPCEKCGKQLNRTALKRHQQTTCSEERAACDICGNMIKKHMLASHKSKVHSTEKAKCSFCSKEYDSREYALSHERWSHREAFDKRRREGVKRVDHLDRALLNQQLGVIENPSDQYTCPVCFNKHGTNALVEAHVKRDHPKEYMSMIMGGIEITSGESAVEDFNAAEYIRDVMEQE